MPASVLQSALASASQQLGRPTGELAGLLTSDPGALLGLGYLGGASGAVDSWAQRLALDTQVTGEEAAERRAHCAVLPPRCLAPCEQLCAHAV